MRDPIIQPIFPTPICVSQLERDFTDVERKFLAKQNSKQTRNVGNSMSHNNYILNEPELADIKKEIEDVLLQWRDNIMAPAQDDIELYITQSWMNWTRPGEWHHKHNHSNSYLSGVFYIAADDTKDKLVFINDTYRTIKIQHKEVNHFNTETWDFSTRTGLLLIFPSWMQHMVEIIPEGNTKTRISLAFNVFVKGTLGSNNSLTELKL
jgi:uncharacterized protein (TIGR02466 family)